MLRIDNNLLQEIGLGGLPEAEKNGFLKHMYETLEMRVGIRLADQMSNEQLDEFERYFEAKDDAGAFKWLETNFPNYKDIVQQEFDKLKAEVAQTAPQILAASQQGQAMSPAALPADYPTAMPAQPVMAPTAPPISPMPVATDPGGFQSNGMPPQFSSPSPYGSGQMTPQPMAPPPMPATPPQPQASGYAQPAPVAPSPYMTTPAVDPAPPIPPPPPVPSAIQDFTQTDDQADDQTPDQTDDNNPQPDPPDATTSSAPSEQPPPGPGSS